MEPHDDGDDSDSTGTANRRRFLVGLGSFGVIGLAGCTGDGGDDSATPTETEAGSTVTGTPTATPTPTQAPLEFPGPPEDATFNVLDISVTLGFRHASIENGHDVLEGLVGDIGDLLGAEISMEIIDNQGPRQVEDFQAAIPSTVEGFEEYDVVVFQNSTGDVFDAEQKSAFREYIENGGNYMGIHAASDTHKDWEWYENTLLGGVFRDHGDAAEPAEIVVEDHTHPATKHLEDRWSREDEWYAFTQNPGDVSNVLATLDKSTLDAPTMEGDHPTAWYHTVGDGRMFYTAGGHNDFNFDEPDFREHLKGGLLWAADYADVSPAAVTVSGSLDQEEPIPISAERTETMTVTVDNLGSASLTDGQALLRSNSEDLTTEAASGARFDTIDAGGSHEAEWNVTISGDAEGEYTLSAAGVYTSDGVEFATYGTLSFIIE